MNYPPAAGGDASPEQIEALANESWRELARVRMALEFLAPVLDRAADAFRKAVASIDRAQCLRGAPIVDQLPAFKDVAAAIGEAVAIGNSLTSAELSSRLALVLAPTDGEQ